MTNRKGEPADPGKVHEALGELKARVCEAEAFIHRGWWWNAHDVLVGGCKNETVAQAAADLSRACGWEEDGGYYLPDSPTTLPAGPG